MRGYFEIGIYNGKHEVNIGTLWRSAYQMGATGIFTIGKRYKQQCSDTCKTFRHIPLRNYLTLDEMFLQIPLGAQLIGIEMGGENLTEFAHPQRAIYLLGAEDSGLPDEALGKCHHVIEIPSIRTQSFNVAVAGSIVMYDRLIKGLL